MVGEETDHPERQHGQEPEDEDHPAEKDVGRGRGRLDRNRGAHLWTPHQSSAAETIGV